MISPLHLINISDKNHSILAGNSDLRKHNFRKQAFWFAITGIIVGLLAFLIKIYSILDPMAQDQSKISVYSSFVARLWFDVFHYFTEQNNLLIIICYLLFIFAFKSKLFNRRDFIVACSIYINLVMFGYWIVIIPSAITNRSFNTNPFELSTTLCFHLICPIIFDLFTIFSVNYPYDCRNPINRINNSRFWFLLCIYLIIYSSYAVAINFTQLPESIYYEKYCPPAGHRFASVYGSITNFNSDCFNLVYDKMGYPSFAQDSCGSIFYLLIAFPVGIVFLSCAFAIVAINNVLSTPRGMVEQIYEANRKFDEEENNFFMFYNQVANQEIKVLKKQEKKK